MSTPVRIPSGRTRDRIDRAILAGDYIRRAPSTVGGPGRHKEWLHFVIHAGSVELLVNFSLVDDDRPVARPGTEIPRIVILTRDAAAWDGGIERFAVDEVEVRGGEIGMQFGPNRAEFRDGEYRLRVRMRDRPIEIDAVLTPLTIPALSNNIRLELAERPIHWFVLPRLEASGTARIDGREFAFDRATAYHDHNWGHFDWGGDFAWEWGFALPDDPDHPWSVVFVRLCDRGQSRVYTQGLFLWKREGHSRIFRGAEMAVAARGSLRARPFKLPGVMNVVSPGSATDVPSDLEAEASAGRDRAWLHFRSEDVAQVCIPNDTDHRGVTIINEVSGSLDLEGEIRGERIRMEGTAMFEFVRAG